MTQTVNSQTMKINKMKTIRSFEEYQSEYQRSIENPALFWEEKAHTFTWRKKWDEVLSWEFATPSVLWFQQAKLNITENCLDRHVKNHPNKIAIIWEPNHPDDDVIQLTYQELYEKVNQFSNALIQQGIKLGDRVCLYMPMIPELAIATLACARVGAIHSIVFAGFSAKALADRMHDAQCKLLITANGNFRGAKEINLLSIVNEALTKVDSVQQTIVVKHLKNDTVLNFDQIWWHDAIDHMSDAFTAIAVDAEDPLFILYTSGSTGAPKGVVHSSAGYMIYAEYSFRNVFQYQDNDVYWCTADIGWITGHSYIIYGPLLAGATTLMFEGVPTFPDPGRFWEIVDKHKVNLFYTAPTAIRALQAFDDTFVTNHDLHSLRVLGTVGEPINEEAWHWYHQKVGKGNCPIVDTWWQTETGGILIAPMAGLWDSPPTMATYPLPGVQPILVDNQGKILEGNNVKGNLCIKFPWPSIIRTTWGNHKRCKEVYFSTYENLYFTGDGCKRDEQGRYRITGRVDDVINVSGHRIGTAEIEDALDKHPQMIECAVVGFPHEIKGQGIMAFAIIDKKPGFNKESFYKEALALVAEQIGSIAKPDRIEIVSNLPKTRSGKIMRRILKKIATGDTQNLGDTSTLVNPEIIDELLLIK